MPDELSEFNTAYTQVASVPGLDLLVVEFRKEHPPDRDILRRLLELGDDEAVRVRLGSYLADRKRHGVWAPIRHHGGKRIKKMRRIMVPFCEFEVTLKAWELLFQELADSDTRHKAINCRTAADLTRTLKRKIEGTLKNIAKTQIHLQFSPDAAAEGAQRPENVVFFGRDGRQSRDQHQLDDDIDAACFLRKARGFIKRVRPQLLESLRKFLEDEGHANASSRDASYREQEKLLRFLRRHRDEILLEPAP